MRFPLVASSLSLALAACATSTPPAASPAAVEVKATGTPGQAAAERVQKLSATVKSVDRAARTLTVQDASGATETIVVPVEVKRFDEIDAGDTIDAVVEQALLLEYQPAGSETVEPTAVVGAQRAPKEGPMGASAAAGVRSTVTVTSIDPSTRMVGFQGPGGKTYEVKAGPGLAIEKLKVGDRLLATYLESTAVTLEKAKR